MSIDHRHAVVDVLYHRLFAIDIFACLHGGNGDRAVPVIGRSDDHCIDIFAIEDFLIVLRREDEGTVDLFHMGQAAVVAVAGGDDFG